MSDETGLDAEGLDAYRREVSRITAERDALKAELAEARGVITALPDPGTVEELREKIAEIFGDPNEAVVHAFLNYAWSETGRIAGKEMAARWQAEDELAELRVAIERLTAERVRAEHFACRPYRCGDEASGMDGKERCHGCRRVWPCPTIAALDAPQRPEDTREADRLTPHRDVMVAAVQEAAIYLDAWSAELTVLQAGAVIDAVLDAVRKAEDTREETGRG